MIRLSSNWTLFLKLFLPVFWIAFFSGFVIAAFVTDPQIAPQIANNKFRLQSVLFVLAGIIFFAFTFFRLKRIDADDSHIYVTNYFKTYRYPVQDIEKITLYNHLILKAAHLKFKGKTSFGKKVIFIPMMSNLLNFAAKNNIPFKKYGDE